MTAHDLLTRAAAKVRETAKEATPGPWQCFGDHLVWPSSKGPAANDPILATMGPAHSDSAGHIAIWDPPTALAAIEQLDLAARDLWAHGLPEGCDSCDGCMECDDLLYAPYVRAALALARSILEED